MAVNVVIRLADAEEVSELVCAVKAIVRGVNNDELTPEKAVEELSWALARWEGKAGDGDQEGDHRGKATGGEG